MSLTIELEYDIVLKMSRNSIFFSSGYKTSQNRIQNKKVSQVLSAYKFHSKLSEIRKSLNRMCI